MSWASAWRLAVGTLTVIPVRPPDVVDRTVAGRAMALAPVAVLPLAVVAAGLGWLAGRTGWPPLLAGLVVVAVLALGTRALHLDGLADTVDGLGSGRDRERSLEIMRRGDVGPMGVIALLLVLGGQAAAASVLASDAADQAEQIGPGWEFYLDRLEAARADQTMPDFGDYWPSMGPYYAGQDPGA